MSRTAWLYLWAIILSGGALAVLTWSPLAQPWPTWIAWGVLTVLATLALLLRAVFTSKPDSTEGTTSYSPVLVILLAGVLLLPPALLILLVLVPHTLQWAKERLAKSNNLAAWYIQPFNMAVYIIAALGSQWILATLRSEPILDLDLTPILTAALVCLTFLILNTVLIGQVLVLARGVTWQESGVFDPENLISDLIMLALGYAVGLLWTISPWLILLGLAPLALVSRALQVPQLRKEARTDSKTGLINARHLMKLFAAELERATRFSRPLTVFMADLDFLRNINNTYGHLAGDIVLVGVGRIIRESVREYDIAARFGGEEFVVVLPETGKGEALAVAERLRQAVANTPFQVPTSATPIYVTMSIGVASFPDDAGTGTALIHTADIAVYQAKLAGRDRVMSIADLPQSARLDLASMEKRDTPAGMPAPAPPIESAVAGAATAPPAAVESAPAAEPDPAATAEDPAGRAAPMTPPPTPPAPPPPPLNKPSQMALGTFVGAVIAAGGAVALSSLLLHRPLDLLALGVFAILAVFFEWFPVNIYGPATSSVTIAVIFAAALTAGIPGVIATGAAVALAHAARMRPRWYKTAFNWATHLLAGTAVVVLMGMLHLPLTFANLPWLLLPAAAGALAQYGLNTGLVAGAISLATGARFTATWKQEFQWLAGHYLALDLLGLLIAVAYTMIGPLGLAAFVVPMAMMRYAQEQYVERTRTSVLELTRMNKELARANHEIVQASAAIQDLNEELFITLAKILDARDPYVGGHAAQVARYAAATARELGLHPTQIEAVQRAGFLHDIGKIAISEQILHKPGKLTAEEYEEIKKHVTIGAEFLSTSRTLRHLAPYVRGHHERWDGGGYPDGLQAEAIPIEARILAVCDAVEAMASDRPYQRGKLPEEIVAELVRCAGSHFDPAVCKAFIKIVEREGSRFVVNSAREVMHKQPHLVPLLNWEHLEPRAIA